MRQDGAVWVWGTNG
ncbi:hypothetical protein [Corallococcus exiguus]|nr:MULTISPECIES: hypothetical protein [Corallococcus]